MSTLADPSHQIQAALEADDETNRDLLDLYQYLVGLRARVNRSGAGHSASS